MEYETYADVIDAYNADDMGYSSLTDYINGQNIKIKEIEMEPMADLQRSLFENKADGGSIGIEVLFGPKRDEYQTGGRIGFNMGGAQFTSGGNISPGTDKRGNVRDDNPFTGGGGGGGPPSIINPPPVIKPPVLTDNFDDRGFLSDLRIKNQKKYLEILNKYKPEDFSAEAQIDGTSNLTDEEEKFMERYGIGEIFRDLSKQNIENFMDIRGGIAPKINPSEITSPRKYDFAEVTDIDLKRAKEPMTKMMDYDTYKSVNPSSKITPYEFEELKKGNITETGTFTAADGGRVGLFMGGPALEGQALSIYNSMNAYGFSDQEIANALQERGLYTPSDSTPDTPSNNIIGAQLDQGGGGGGGITELQETFTREAGSTPKISKDAFFGLGKFFQGKERGTLGDRLLAQSQNISSKIPLPGAILGYLRSPFNPDSPTYNPNLPAQLNFLEGSPMVTRTTGQFKDPRLGAVEGNFMETTGALIGRDPNTGALKYGPGSVLAGKNVISGFGTNDYEQALMDYIAKMSANTRISAAGKAARLANAKAELAALTGRNADDISIEDITTQSKIAKTNKISAGEAAGIMQAIADDNRATESRGRQELGSSYDEGTYCFDPNTLVQMADGSEKKIKEIQLGDQTKGGEVTGVFQFKASDEIHDYKGVTVAGSHYVKEDGKFIMVKDSPLSVKIDKIPVVYSLDTTGRRIFINDIEFADYNGDGVAKNFLTNAGVDLTGFDTEVLRQVEHRLI